MKCRICGQKMQARVAANHPDADHHLQPGLIDGGLCLGCALFALQMQEFLIRACDRTVMGNWTEGWLKEIIADPKRYL